MASPVTDSGPGWAHASYSNNGYGNISPHPYPSYQQQTSTTTSQGWDLAVYDISILLEQHEKGTGKIENTYQGITTRHWKPTGSRTHCASQGCDVKFSLLKYRNHHCRRCGDLFCKACTSYKRKLNALSHPDPNGKSYQVCKDCFNQGPQTMGQFRQWTSIFQQCRNAGKQFEGPLSAGDNGFVSIGNFREKVNIPKECRRLKEGFKSSVNSPGWKRALLDVKNVVKIPEWQRAGYFVYGNMAINCADCKAKFSLVKVKHNCSVCGAGVCGSCSKKHLIVYFPDGERRDSATEPKMAIIKIIGCPEKEPEVCEYLRVCQHCNAKIQDVQVSEYQQQQQDLEPLDLKYDPWDDILKVNDLLNGVQVKIDSHLPKYQELIEGLEANPGSAPGLPQAKSNTQILAKAQGDLADHFTQWVMTLQRMKKLRPETKGQLTICRNMIKCKYEFYQDNMATFRLLRRKLETVTPAAVLECIQNIVDRNAINSCYLSLKQLALEMLHLNSKHQLDDRAVLMVVETSKVVETELKKSVEAASESWDTHQQCADELLQLQIKEHRLIRPSRRLTQRYGSKHVEAFLEERSATILQQIYLQMTSKCADRSFQESKESLKSLQEELWKDTGN